MIDDVPALTESAPREGPTILWSTIVTGTGNAPARNTIAISSASCIESIPSITVAPPKI